MINLEDDKKISEFISSIEFTKAMRRLEDDQDLRTAIAFLDDYEFGINEDLTEELLNALKYKYPKYSFSIMPWHNIGFDLLITDIQRQKAYDLLPKTKTMKDVADEIERNGVKTDILCHCNPDEKITEQEYKEFVASWKGTLDD